MPYNPSEPRDRQGSWTSGGETATDRYARTFYPDHPTDSDIRFQRVAGTAPTKAGRELTPEEGREIVGKAKGWEGTPYAPPGTRFPGPNAKRGQMAAPTALEASTKFMANPDIHFLTPPAAISPMRPEAARFRSVSLAPTKAPKQGTSWSIRAICQFTREMAMYILPIERVEPLLAGRKNRILVRRSVAFAIKIGDVPHEPSN